MRTELRFSLLALALLAGCAGRPVAAATPAPVPVIVARAEAVPERPCYSGPGTVAAQHVYRVAFEVAGRVSAVPYDVGDHVVAGATLASLERNDYAAQARVADARALAAAAAAAKAANGARAQERAAAAAAEAAARAGLERTLAAQRLADANAARYADLFRQGDVSAQANDQTQTAARDAAAATAAARAAVAQAQQQRALTDAGARSEDRAAAFADARGAAAGADLAAIALQRTHLVSPAEAFVLERDVEPGNVVQPGAVAFVLSDARTPDALVAVPEAHLAGIEPGTRAEIRDATHVWRGRVIRIEPAADAATHSATVRVHAAGLRLAPGAVVNVRLGTLRAAAQAAVPLGALVAGDGAQRSVAVYDPVRHTTYRRRIHVAGADGDRALVDGIAPGTPVVAEGAHLVAPGATVAVVQP